MLWDVFVGFVREDGDSVEEAPEFFRRDRGMMGLVDFDFWRRRNSLLGVCVPSLKGDSPRSSRVDGSNVHGANGSNRIGGFIAGVVLGCGVNEKVSNEKVSNEGDGIGRGADMLGSMRSCV
jgi:hypothetical protein